MVFCGTGILNPSQRKHFSTSHMNKPPNSLHNSHSLRLNEIGGYPPPEQTRFKSSRLRECSIMHNAGIAIAAAVAAAAAHFRMLSLLHPGHFRTIKLPCCRITQQHYFRPVETTSDTNRTLPDCDGFSRSTSGTYSQTRIARTIFNLL